MFDTLIVGGTLYDGSGGAGYGADIAIKDGVIAAIGTDLGVSHETIAAHGAIVTPGFIDLHTHYDGQISWDEEMRPSVNHGVTTIVMGNCGVGFAPCRKDDREKLIKLMEGVEDIPGTTLWEGIRWNWESFPEYMDAIESQAHTIDFAVMVPHDPLRVFAMGDRAIAEEPANEDDIRIMRDLVAESLKAGAVGFSTGRSDFHRTSDGDWTPASEAKPSELVGIAKALNRFDYGVLHAVNDFNQERDGDQFDEEFDILDDYFSAAPGHKSSMTLMQRDLVPDHWRRILKRTEDLRAKGTDLYVQAAPRAIGTFLGLQSTFHPLMAFPSYIAIMDLPLGEKVARLRDPKLKTKILAETPIKLAGPGTSTPPMVDTMIAMTEHLADKLFRLDPNEDGVVDYEQPHANSIAAQARVEGVSVWSKLYDTLLEDGGNALIYFPAYNYTDMNYDAVHTMMTHEAALPGLSDGGAHVGFICDASFPTFLLSYWARDRDSKNIPLELAVQMLSADGADYLGLQDRGRIKVGMKADLNVIDFEGLKLGVPYMVKDLPAGGQRLMQPVEGFRATLVSGETIIANDRLTKARPGRLVRMGQG